MYCLNITWASRKEKVEKRGRNDQEMKVQERGYEDASPSMEPSLSAALAKVIGDFHRVQCRVVSFDERARSGLARKMRDFRFVLKLESRIGSNFEKSTTLRAQIRLDLISPKRHGRPFIY